MKKLEKQLISIIDKIEKEKRKDINNPYVYTIFSEQDKKYEPRPWVKISLVPEYSNYNIRVIFNNHICSKKQTDYTNTYFIKKEVIKEIIEHLSFNNKKLQYTLTKKRLDAQQ